MDRPWKTTGAATSADGMVVSPNMPGVSLVGGIVACLYYLVETVGVASRNG